MMDATRLAVIASASLVAATAAWAVATRTLPPALRAPRVDAPAVERIAARPPTIGPLDAFAVNDVNPFVPWWERTQAKPDDRDHGHQREDADHGDRGGAMAPPPTRQLPRRAPSDSGAPECVGLIAARRGGTAAALVRIGAEAPHALRIGDSHAGWRLDAIDGERLAWSAPDGSRCDVIVAPRLAAAERR